MMAPAPARRGGNGRLSAAGKDVKNIADGLHPKFPKRAYKGDEMDFTTTIPGSKNEERAWKGKMGKRGPRRLEKEENVSSTSAFLTFTNPKKPVY